MIFGLGQLFNRKIPCGPSAWQRFWHAGLFTFIVCDQYGNFEMRPLSQTIVGLSYNRVNNLLYFKWQWRIGFIFLSIKVKS